MATTRSWLLTPILLLATLAPAVAADPVNWRTEYVAARREAAEAKRPLLIVVSAANCPSCDKLQKEALADTATTAIIAERFLALKLDAAREAEFVRAMRITTLPTTIVAGPDGKVYGYFAGHLDAAPFRENVVKALDKVPAVAPMVPAVKPPVAVKVAPVEVREVATPPTPAERRDAAMVAYAREEYGEALDRFETLIRFHPTSDQSREAAAYVVRIKADIDRLAAAAAEFDEQTAAAYFALAESWVKRGKPKEAAACYAKAIQLAPKGKTAELAQGKLSLLKKD